MNRREFITNSYIASVALIMPSFAGMRFDHTVEEHVKNVHVIFKTHLDIGFTDLSANVIQNYFQNFIPNVLSLTEKIRNENNPNRYIWTTGSWLIYKYLEESSSKDRQRMERAIESGDFVWHGLPFTTHSELIDPSMFRLATTYASTLDSRFNRQTLAAKMTDVPGHSRGVVPVLADTGIELLHIGVNEASALPDVPPLFIWESSEGKKITVMYDHSYGGVSLLPGGNSAVAICFTSDNQGPHTPEQIANIYSHLRERFPNASVFASDLNKVALEIKMVSNQLPVITQECGDTWIHGAASDPLLMAQFRELSRLRLEWIKKGQLKAFDAVDMAYGKPLLCIPEHTWGLTIRKLGHWDIYDMDKFRASRTLPEFKLIEQSWNEKRSNINHAISVLPVDLKEEALRRLESLRPKINEANDMEILDHTHDNVYESKHFRIGFSTISGAICFLEHKISGKQWASESQPLGLFSYQTFSTPDFNNFMKQYVPEKLINEEWVILGWNKPGLDKSSAKTALYCTTPKELGYKKTIDGVLFHSILEVKEAGDSGCPQKMKIETFLPDNESELRIVLKWFDKPASRLPEACWFSFIPVISENGHFELDKIGQSVSPLDVIKNGNRNIHGVISGVSYKDERSNFFLETLDAFLVAPGRRSLLLFDNQQPDMAGGLHFCLFNNVTGENFRMWFEDDIQFRFSLKFT